VPSCNARCDVQEERKRKKEEDEQNRRAARAQKMAEFEKWKNPPKANFVISKKVAGEEGAEVSIISVIFATIGLV